MPTENTLREALCLLAGNDRPCVGAVRLGGSAADGSPCSASTMPTELTRNLHRPVRVSC